VSTHFIRPKKNLTDSNITFVVRGKKVLPCDMVMVIDLIVLTCKATTTIYACLGSSVTSAIVIRNVGKRNLLGHDFVDDFAFRHHMFIKTSHNIRSAVHGGRGLILGQGSYSIAAKAANQMFVNNVRFCIRVGLLFWCWWWRS